MVKIELGGNIEIESAEEIDRNNLVILKKMLGIFAKKLSEEHEKFEKLTFNFKKQEKDNNEIELTVKIADKEYKAEASDKNLFFALNETFEKIL